MNRLLLTIMLCSSVLLFGNKCYAGTTKYEAESATLSEGANAATDANASNGGYVKMNNGNITFIISAEKKAMYTLTIHYQNNYGANKINNIVVNGVQVASPTFKVATSFTDIQTNASLNAGSNEVSITNSWGWIDVDYISISEYSPDLFNITKSLVTTNATESAKELYSFLLDNFGKKTISGIMTGNLNASADVLSQDDVNEVYLAGGHYPSLVGFDLLFATGVKGNDSWYKEYTNTTITLAKEIWNKGGIPAFSWHWKDPSDSKDAFYVQSAAGSNEYTDFDFTKAFVTGTTEWNTGSGTYNQIVEDIDHIASLFLQLQNAGVAAIFRPVHESGGSWFWWSCHSEEEFAALYRLIYDRMVTVNGVKNLIWVFNPQDASYTSWNPGESYFDVLSVDIYNDANNHDSNFAAFSSLKDNFGKTKILALTENGPIPDVNKMYNDGATWSWWMPWYETWGGGYISNTANSVWTSNLNDERIITLDKMPGWGKTSNIIDNIQSEDVVYPSHITDEFFISCKEESNINITDATGHSIRSYISKGGIMTIPCSNWSKGIYFVQITSKSNLLCFKIIK